MGQAEDDGGRAGASCRGALIAELSIGGALGEADRDPLGTSCADVRTITANSDIIREGDSPDHVHLVLDGWAARYKIVPDGRRQITAFLIPGDFCDAHVAILRRMDHGIVALTPVTVAFIPHAVIQELPLKR